ncbi:phage tail protein [Salmonella enterica subsp. enterica serovar Chandans]|nr:phage tail protein [Salmonella enterica]EDX0904759.1 phage tail protein [Salmonella enterica subsp. enterica]EKB3331630.1 phage tail protein [Salmonella enterica subsp. enterica serovar Chandans]EEF5710162.1 phage tail protein [Salmonella enterica]EEG6275493.1 phage tail protein [Salmonella enterica subsp. enterica]
MKTFHWQPREGMKSTSAPAVVEIKLGDGYSQRRPAGLNALLKSWSPSFRVNTHEDAAALEAFLAGHGGYRAFLWRPPLLNRTVRVVCKEWESVQNGAYTDFSCKFEQVVA